MFTQYVVHFPVPTIRDNLFSRCTAHIGTLHLFYIKGHCISHEYYDCYDSYLRFIERGNHNQMCLLNIVFGSRSEVSAHDHALQYALGCERQLIKRATSSECISPNVGIDTWIAGVGFLYLSGGVLLAWAMGGVLYHGRDSQGSCVTRCRSTSSKSGRAIRGRNFVTCSFVSRCRGDKWDAVYGYKCVSYTRWMVITYGLRKNNAK